MSSLRSNSPLAFATIVSFIAAAPANAQQSPLQVAPFQQANDIIVGKDKPGPYPLSWSGLTIGISYPVDVTVDGTEIGVGGYTIDSVKGTITFSATLKATSMARVTYMYDPANAHRNADYTATPVTVPLMRAAGTNFQLTAMPDSAVGGTSGTTKMVYDVDRSMSLLGGGLSSKALFSSSGSALNFGYKYGTARNGFDSSYQSTEKDFALGVGKAMSLTDASAKTSLSARLSPARDLGFGFGFSQKSSDTTPGTEAQTANVSMTAITPDKKKQASLVLTDVDNTTPTKIDQNQDVALKVQPVPTLSFSAEQKADKTTAVGTAVGTPPVDTVNTSLAAEVTPIPGAKLSGAVLTNSVNDTKTASTAVNALVGSGKAIEIGGGYTDRSASTVVAYGTTRATVALRPLGKALTLTGAYTMNPEQNGVVTEAIRQELGLTAKVGALDLGTNYAMTTLNGLPLSADAPDPQYGQVSLTMGLRFSKFTSMKGNYQDGLLYAGAINQTNAVAPRGARVYGLGVTHSLGSAFSINMTGSAKEDRSVANPTEIYQAQANIAAKF